jgi:ketosteroid isomerase-like protein
MTDIRDAVRALEDRRYDAMLAGDIAVLDELLSDRLAYTHSTGGRDTKASYLEKVRNGTFVYDSIEHPVDTILAGEDYALVVGQMVARVWRSGELVTLRNAALAVWVREEGTIRLLAYQPTPLPG